MVSATPHGFLCLCAASMFLEQIMGKSGTAQCKCSMFILLGTRFPALVKLQYDTMYPLQPRNPNIPYFFVCQVRVSPSMAEK